MLKRQNQSWHAASPRRCCTKTKSTKQGLSMSTRRASATRGADLAPACPGNDGSTMHWSHWGFSDSTGYVQAGRTARMQPTFASNHCEPGRLVGVVPRANGGSNCCTCVASSCALLSARRTRHSRCSTVAICNSQRKLRCDEGGGTGARMEGTRNVARAGSETPASQLSFLFPLASSLSGPSASSPSSIWGTIWSVTARLIFLVISASPADLAAGPSADRLRVWVT